MKCESGWASKESGDLALVLGRGDRARRVDQHAARTERRGAGGEDHRLCLAHLARHAPGSIRQRRSGRACSVPSPEHGGSTSTRSYTAPSGLASCGVRHLDAHVAGTQPLRGAHERAGARAVALDRHAPPLAPHQRGEVRALAARRRAQVEHALARLRVASTRATSIAARDCASKAPARHSGEACTSNAPSSTSASGSSGSAWVRTGELPGQRGGVGEQRVRRAAPPRRARCRQAISGARSLGAQLLPPQSRDPLRVRVLDGGLLGRLRRSASPAAPPLLRARPGAARR